MKVDVSADLVKGALGGMLFGATAVLGCQSLCAYLQRPKDLKVVYFAMSGRAGPIRAALQLGKIKYENAFVNSDSLKELKPKLPFGQVPVIEMDGEVAAQSGAILRYVGKLSGLYPTNAYRALKVDEIIDGVDDTISVLIPSLMESDKDKKLRMRKDLIKSGGALRQRLQRLADRMESNTGAFAAGSRLSIADLSVASFTRSITNGEGLDFIPNAILNEYPALSDHLARMNTLQCWGLEYASFGHAEQADNALSDKGG